MEVLPLGNREKSQTVSEDQVQFLLVIVLPFADFLQMVLSNTRESTLKQLS